MPALRDISPAICSCSMVPSWAQLLSWNFEEPRNSWLFLTLSVRMEKPGRSSLICRKLPAEPLSLSEQFSRVWPFVSLSVNLTSARGSLASAAMLSGGMINVRRGTNPAKRASGGRSGVFGPMTGATGTSGAPMTGVAGAGAVWAAAAAVRHSQAHHALPERDKGVGLGGSGSKLRWAGSRQNGSGISESQPLEPIGNKVSFMKALEAFSLLGRFRGAAPIARCRGLARVHRRRRAGVLQ